MFKNLINNLTNRQKIAIVILAQIIIVIIIVSILNVALQPKGHIDVENRNEAESVPSEEWNGMKNEIWYLLVDNVAELTRSDIDDAKIRDGTYTEETENDITTARFLLDIDSLKQTFFITISWSDEVELYDYLSIDCPPQDQMKYKETVCYGMYNNTYSLDLYLPYTVYPESEEGAPNYMINGNEADKTIDIMVSACDAERFKKEAMDYLKSTPIKLSEYTINYEINDVDIVCE